MPSTVDELTVNYEEEGVLLVKELDKIVLTKGTWSTVVYKYQQWNNSTQNYGAEAYTIRRYRKMNDEYRQQAKFNISSRDQAQKLIAALQTWLAQPPVLAGKAEAADEG